MLEIWEQKWFWNCSYPPIFIMIFCWSTFIRTLHASSNFKWFIITFLCFFLRKVFFCFITKALYFMTCWHVFIFSLSHTNWNFVAIAAVCYRSHDEFPAILFTYKSKCLSSSLQQVISESANTTKEILTNLKVIINWSK